MLLLLNSTQTRLWAILGLLILGAGIARSDTRAIEYHTQAFDFRGFSLSVRLPTAYQLDILATDLQQPRMLTFAANGDLLIGSRTGNVYQLRPPFERSRILIQLDDYPHSVALRPGEILIARTSGLYRADYEPGQTLIDPQTVSLLAKLPGGRGHNTRTVRIGPDQKIYVSLGIAGNCSDQFIGPGYDFDDWRGGIMVLDETTTPPRWQPFATGLRNPVGFDWHPVSKTLYASNNGPDHWGYEQPPEVFSRLLPQSFHGMPWYQFDGQTFARDACIATSPPRNRSALAKPAALFPARNAPMGVAFVPDHGLDPSFRHDAVVALHGSWATLPDGSGSGDPASRREPKLVSVRFEGNEAVRVDDLITGFQLDDGRRWARPAGVAVGPDGGLYFTSDEGINGLFRMRKR